MSLFTVSGAADVVFPDAGGDLSDPEKWGEIYYQENFNTNRLSLTKSGTYTALNDIAFGGITLSLSSGNFVFDMTSSATGCEGNNGRTIDLSGVFYAGGSANNVTVKGGTWKLANKAFYSWLGYARAHNSFLRITDGACIEGVSSFSGGYGNYGTEIVVEGGSRVSANELRPDHDRGSSSTLVISNGAQVTVATFTGDYGSRVETGYDFSTKTILSGEGTKLDVTNSFKAGTSSFVKMYMTDKAKCNSSRTIYLGGSSPDVISTNFYLEVSDGAEFTINGSAVYFGQYGHGSVIEVVRGGTMNINADQFLLNGNASNPTNSGYGAMLVVSNGVFNSKNAPIMGAGEIRAGTNGLVRIIGRDSRFNIESASGQALFSRAPNCKYEIIDACWTNNNPSSMTFTSQYSGGCCTMELTKGSEYYSTNEFSIANLNYDCTNNVLKILDGSRFFAGKKIFTSSCNNSFVVSNATMETLGDLYVTQKSQSAQIHGFSNNWFIVQGASPRTIATNGTMYVQYESTLKFELPAGGYESGLVPVRAKNFSMDDSSNILIANAAARIANLDKSEYVTLVETSNGITIPDGVLERTNESLPDGSFCRISEDGKSLELKLFAVTATVIILR